MPLVTLEKITSTRKSGRVLFLLSCRYYSLNFFDKRFALPRAAFDCAQMASTNTARIR